MIRTARETKKNWRNVNQENFFEQFVSSCVQEIISTSAPGCTKNVYAHDVFFGHSERAKELPAHSSIRYVKKTDRLVREPKGKGKGQFQPKPSNTTSNHRFSGRHERSEVSRGGKTKGEHKGQKQGFRNRGYAFDSSNLMMRATVRDWLSFFFCFQNTSRHIYHCGHLSRCVERRAFWPVLWILTRPSVILGVANLFRRRTNLLSTPPLHAFANRLRCRWHYRDMVDTAKFNLSPDRFNSSMYSLYS